MMQPLAMSPLFDSHAHLIAADNSRYPPTPLKGALDRELVPFTAEDLLRHMDENAVERAVVVQRAHVYGFNNAYVADSAAQYPHRLVSVGMIDSSILKRRNSCTTGSKTAA